MKPSNGAGPLALFLVALFAAAATAGTIDEHRRSLGWQAEHGEVVVIGEVRSRTVDPEEMGVHRATVHVAERLKGPADLPATLTVIWTGEAGPSVADGRRAIFFLLAVPEDRRPAGMTGPFHALVVGPFSAVAVGGGAADPQVGFVRERLALVARRADAVEVRKHLLAGMAAPSRVVVFSAALDFARRDGVEEGLTEADVAAVVTAFARHAKIDRVKRALVGALGATQSRGAIPTLAEFVLAGDARPLRGTIGDALERIGDASAIKALESGMKSDRAAVRADVVNLLGRTGLAAGTAVVVKALGDPAGEVRVEAGLAVGELARAFRARKEDAPAAADALAAAFDKAAAAKEKKALLWAAAQLDTQAGYAIVRKAAADDADPAMREFARRVLENPRRRIVL